MNSEIRQWLIVYLVPYILIGLATLGGGFVLLPLGATLGIYIGFSSDAAYFTAAFKRELLLMCLAAAAVFLIGFAFRRRLIGKIINAVGFYAWCIIGLIGFGPQ